MKIIAECEPCDVVLISQRIMKAWLLVRTVGSILKVTHRSSSRLRAVVVVVISVVAGNCNLVYVSMFSLHDVK